MILLVMLAACGAVFGGDTGSAGAGAEPPARSESASSHSDAPADKPEKSDKSKGGSKDKPADKPKSDKPKKDKPEPEPESKSYSAGIYMVGDDIKPGTYRTDGPGADSLMGMCYWARLSGTSGELQDIIANGNEQGQSVVTVESSDAALELSGDCEWTLAE